MNPLMREAAQKGDTDTVIRLLKEGADIDKPDFLGDTALMNAARAGRLDTVKALLDRGADVNKYEFCFDNTALMYAASNGSLDIVKDLLAKNADVHKANREGVTALIWASQYGHANVVKELLLAGADANKHDTYERTALKCAVSSGSLDTVKALLDGSRDFYYSALESALENKHIEIIQYLSENVKHDLSITKGIQDITKLLRRINDDVNIPNDKKEIILLSLLRMIMLNYNQPLGRDVKYLFDAIFSGYVKLQSVLKFIDEILSYNIKIKNNPEDKGSNQTGYFAILDLLKEINQKQLKSELISLKAKYLNDNDDQKRNAYVSLLCHLGMKQQIEEIFEHKKADIVHCMENTYSSIKADDGDKTSLKFYDESSLVYYLLSLADFGYMDFLVSNLYRLNQLYQNNNPNPANTEKLTNLLSKIESQLLSAKDGDDGLFIKASDELYRLLPFFGTLPKTKDKLASVIFKIDITNNFAGHEDVLAHILANKDLLAAFIRDESIASAAAERLIKFIENSNHSSDLDQLKENLFSTMLHSNTKLFFELLKDDSKDHAVQCEFIRLNFGAAIRQYPFNKDHLYEIMKKFLENKQEKIPYLSIIPYIKYNHELEKIVQYNLAPAPKNDVNFMQRNNASTNPILLAAAGEKFVAFEYMYDNRNREPWSTFWQQTGDQENILIKFLLRMPLPGSNISQKVVDEMLLYTAQIKGIIATMDRSKINELYEEIVTDGYIHTEVINNMRTNMAKLDRIIYPNPEGSNSIRKWWWRYSKTQAILNSQAAKNKQLSVNAQSDDAHDTAVEAAAKKIHINDFTPLLSKIYPQCDSQEERLNKAMIDARLLIIKSLIEYKPTDASSVKEWEKIVDLCGMEDYYKLYAQSKEGNNLDLAKMKSISFANFKRIALANKKLMKSVVEPPQGQDSALSIHLKQLKHTNYTTYVQKCFLTWNPYSPILVNSTDGEKYHYALESQGSAREFTLFTLLLATEDVEKEIESIEKDDYTSLYPFVNNTLNPNLELKAIRALIQKKILKSNIAPETDMDWLTIKNIVLKHALLEHSALCASFPASVLNAIRERSCQTGVFCIFSSAILSKHRKYYQAGLDANSSEIQTIMSEKFETALQAKIISILIGRLQDKKQKFHFFTTYKPKKTSDITVNNSIRSIIDSSPKTLEELFQVIRNINDPNARQEIVGLLFPSVEMVAPNDQTQILVCDKEISTLFDAFFTVTPNNFSDLFSGSRRILKYSANLTGQLTPDNDNTISLDQFDAITGRAKFLRTCFDSRSLPDQIAKKLKEEDGTFTGLSEYDLSIIKYYSVAIAETPRLMAIASSISTDLNQILSLKMQQDTPIVMNIPANTAASKHETNLGAFFSLLSTKKDSTSQQSMANLIHVRQIKDSLFQAVCAEANGNLEFELDIDEFEKKLADESINLMPSCKILVEYLCLPENSPITTTSIKFTTLVEFVTSVATNEFNKGKTGENTVYQACFDIYKAINVPKLDYNVKTCEDTWLDMLRRKTDYNIA